ncbi:collagen alpha-1(XXIII) chain [Notothenia coriiceps]|uniref:Collagen alpha-1(XXIII) chain n=1 Tax=Notothenia coriiceps TaxID=8208 RepID=A0A6I9PS90_9TELE|nr:PREDICTED: collagen alpha-1(XXIII) chain-like [Notothenia coriiceps]
MDTASHSIGESKPVCEFAPKSSVQRWLPGFPIALCLLLSMSSITVCLLMSLKTFQLESRMQMQMDKASIFQPHRACLNEDGTLTPELSSSVGKFVEEKVVVLLPKLRTTRDVGQECSCPPGNRPLHLGRAHTETAGFCTQQISGVGTSSLSPAA